MNTKSFKKVFFILILAGFSINGAHAANLPAIIKVEVKTDPQPELLQGYLEIKDALVDDDFVAAKKAAISMTRAFEDYVKDLSQPAAFVVTLNEFANARDLESQRLVFKELSQHIYDSVRNLEINKTIYWQSCPMALEGEGAKWISLDKQVKNPFMGQDMPSCGSTIETI